VAVDRHGGDAAGLGDLAHGELAGVVHALGLVDERWGHRGFAAAGATTGAGGEQAGLGAFLDEGGFVFGHEGEHAEDEVAVGGGGVHDAVGQRPHPDSAFTKGGDDVDEVAQVAAEAVNFSEDQGVPAA